MSATEHRIEDESGWLLNRETGKTTEFVGVRILWRFVGERKWRRRVIVPDAAEGQTVASLKRDAAEIVSVLAALAEASDNG